MISEDNNSSMVLLHPSASGGVLDFVESTVVALGKCQPGTTRVRRLALSKNSPIPSVGAGEIVIIHYSGYGFAKRGAPLWLLDVLQVWRNAKIKIGVFFHELYASGPPWRSSFWLSPVQRYVARRLAEMSDFWMTSRDASADWLCCFASNKPHTVLPVFSSVGELASIRLNRRRKIVVFGGSGLRMATYREGGKSLFDWSGRQNLEVHDIGPDIKDSAVVRKLLEAGVIVHGRLSAEEVSRHLATATFGIVAYPVEYVAKSSVFAAYCAHGVCPILISKSNVISDGLHAGINYQAGVPASDDQGKFVEHVSEAAWNWYQPHQLSAHVDALYRLLNEVNGEGYVD